jgi:hypothetical protein
VAAWPNFIGIVNASSFGVGGIILNERGACRPTVFWLQWPADITTNAMSVANPGGKLTNSDLKIAGLLILWLCIKGVCGPVAYKYFALFRDNSPTVSWVERMALRYSWVAAQLVWALALRLNLASACPLTPLHIPEKRKRHG